MKIFDQIKEVLKEYNVNDFVTLQEMQNILKMRYGTKPSSVILSDFCYNRYNNGIPFKNHIFVYFGEGRYKYLGENYPYTGKVYHKPKGGREIIIGEWVNGVIIDSSQESG